MLKKARCGVENDWDFLFIDPNTRDPLAHNKLHIISELFIGINMGDRERTRPPKVIFFQRH